MCLKARNKRKVAEENIVVYKILRKFTDLDKNEVYYEPPYQYWGQFTYKQGINSAGNEFEEVHRSHDILVGDYICVEGGFLHAFTEKPYALAYRSLNFDNLSSLNHYTLEYNVYKMVIPKGTEYFIGCQHDICAKELLWEDMTPCEESKISKEYVFI